MVDNLKVHASEVATLWQRVRAIAGDDDQALVDTLDGETDTIEALRRVTRLAIEADAHAQSCKLLVDSYRERQKTLEDRAQRYRNALAGFLQEVGEKSVRLPEGTISWRDSGPSLVGDIPPAADLPDNCVKMQRVKHEPSIKAALADGLIIPGLSLSNGGVSLTIRRA